MNTKILIGFTGGLRSSVLATLLAEQGYEVVPLFIDFSDFSHPLWQTVSPSVSDPRHAVLARERASHLGLELQVLPAGGLFEQKVVDPLIHSAISGRHEEAGALLHSKLLLPVLHQLSLDQACENWATGHRVIQHEKSLFWEPITGDQLPLVAFSGQEILERALFPLGAFQQAHLQKLGAQIGVQHEGSTSIHHPSVEQHESWRAWAGGRVSAEFLQRGWVRHPQIANSLLEHQGPFDYPVGLPLRNINTEEMPGLEGRTLWAVGFERESQTVFVLQEDQFLRNSLLLEELTWWEPSVRPEGLSVQALVCSDRGEARPAPGRLHFNLSGTGRLELRRGAPLIFKGTRLLFLAENRLVGTARVSTGVSIES